MITICPKCALTLDVTAGDLRLGQGYVRCGRCSSVFNALASLREEPGADRGTLEPPAAPDGIPDSALEFDPSRSDLSKLFVGPSGDIEQMGSGNFETIVLEGDDGEPPWTSGEPSADDPMEQELRELVSRLDRDLIGLDPDPIPPRERVPPPGPARAPQPAAKPVTPASGSAAAAGSVLRSGSAAPAPPSGRNAAPAAPTGPPRPAATRPPAAPPPVAAAKPLNPSQSVKRPATAPFGVPAPASPAAPARRPPQFADAGARRLPPGIPSPASGSTPSPVRAPGAAPGPAVAPPASPIAPSAPNNPAAVLNRAPLARPQTPRPQNVRAPLPAPRPAATANSGQAAVSRAASTPANPPATSASVSAPTVASAPVSTAAQTPAAALTPAHAPAPAAAAAAAPTSASAPPSRASGAGTTAAALREPTPVASEEDVEPFAIAPAVAAAVAAAAAARRRSRTAPGDGPATQSAVPVPAPPAAPSPAGGAQALLPAPAVGGAETAAEDFLLNLDLDAPIPSAPRAPAAAATAVSAALVLLLFAQVIHHYRGDLVAHGWFAGPLTQLYAKLGMPITPDWDVEAYEIRQLGAAAPATPGGSLVIRASVKNGAPRTQPVPVIQLTLQDRYGNRLGSRALEPGEYLASGSARTTLAPGERVDTEIAVADPGQSAVGFEIDTCLHRSNGTLRCASGEHRRP